MKLKDYIAETLIARIQAIADNDRDSEDTARTLAEMALHFGATIQITEDDADPDDLCNDGDALWIVSGHELILSLGSVSEVIAKWTRCVHSDYDRDGDWSSDEDTNGGDSLPDYVEAILDVFGVEDDLPAGADEPTAPEECAEEDAGAVVRFRNPYSSQKDWEVIEHYATLEEAERAVANHQRGFARQANRGSFGPEWDAQEIASAGVDTEVDYRERMAALVDDEGEIAVVGMDGDEIARFADEESAQEYVSMESTVFHLREGRDNAYLPRSIVPAGAPLRRDGQFSTTWIASS